MTLKNNASMLKAEGIRLKVKHSRDGTLWTFTEEKSQERSSQSSQSSPGRDSRSKLDKIGDNLGEGSPKVVTRSSQESSSISTSKGASVTTVTTVTTFPNTSSAKLSAENVQPLVGQKPEPVNQSKENQGPVSFAQNNVSRQPSKFEGIIAHNESGFLQGRGKWYPQGQLQGPWETRLLCSSRRVGKSLPRTPQTSPRSNNELGSRGSI